MESEVLKIVEEISGYTPRDMIFMYSDYERMAKECKAYEDIGTVEDFQRLVTAQNEGRLVELPCKVGDAVWTNICILGDYFKKKDRPYRCEVVFIGLTGKSGYVNVVFKNGRMHQFVLEDFGKTVFLTSEEAKKSIGGTA